MIYSVFKAKVKQNIDHSRNCKTGQSNSHQCSIVKYFFRIGYLKLKQDIGIPKGNEQTVLWTKFPPSYLNNVKSSENLL